MPPFPYGETVTRLRATVTTDSTNSTQYDWTSPAHLDIPGCAFDPGSSSEPLETGRTAVITQPTVYAPAGSDVLPADRMVVRGVTYEVDGRPASWVSPFSGWAPGMTVVLRDVEG